MSPTFHIFTTGCKANQWDSYIIAEGLKAEGLVPGGTAAADIAVINGCTLTQRAEADIRRHINRIRQTGRGIKVVLTGCHGQVYPERSFGADLVLGQEEKFAAPLYSGAVGVVRREGRDFSMDKGSFSGPMPARTRFFFKIQDGCDRFCSYCIVPYGRGRVRSRPLQEIIEGMAVIKARGVKEVVLTGIDIASYRDDVTGTDLVGLLHILEGVETPQRIRLSSVDPGYINEELASLLAASGKLAKSIHIPLQSADGDILKRMGRRYGAESIRWLMEMLKERVETIAVGMDVLVGFPGEDEAAFQETFRFLESIPVSYLHVFPYSDRPGTPASRMEEKVPASVKRERVALLRALDGRKREVFYRGFLGAKVSVIPEGKVYKGAYLRGYTENYIPVYLPYEKSIENKVVDVTIKGMRANLLFGER